MKKRNQIIAAIMAATIIMTPASFAYAAAAPDGNSNAQEMYGDAYTNWKTNSWDNGLSTDWTKVSITPGSDETSMNFAWYSKQDDEVSLTYGQNPDLSDGKTVTISTTATGRTDKNGVTYNSNKATITGLSQGATYFYQVAGKDIKSFKTGTTDSFRFAFVGDPQIGSSNEEKGKDTPEFYSAQSNAVANDSYNWSQTLTKIQKAGSDFVVSAGDQIQTTAAKKIGQTPDTISEIEYTGYLSPEALTSLPVATTVGNHDADNANYKYHFNVPNLSALGDNGTVGGDYYFTYGNVLFMMLNTQDTNSAEHIEFIESAIAKNSDCKWKVVTLHQDIYGSAEHSNEPEIVNLRYALTPTFEKNGIDVVLTGHDHAYSRSKFLSGNQTSKTTDYTKADFKAMLGKDVDYSGTGTIYTAPANIKDDTTDEAEKAYLSYLSSVMDADRITETGEYVVDPQGILYLTASSSSGSKYYDLVPRQQTYIANRWQEDVPTYSLIDVTETTMTINTYRTDNDAAIDNTVTIVKSADKSELSEKADEIKAEITNGTLVESDYTTESWNALTDALEEADNIAAEAPQAYINEVLEKLSSARAGLVKKTDADIKDNENKPADTEVKDTEVKDTKQADTNTTESKQTDTKNNQTAKASTGKVKTGDDSSTMVWTLVCIMGIGALGAATVFIKKRESKEK